MLPVKCNLNKLLCYFYLLFVLQACAPGKPGIRKNNSIDAAKRETFHQLNNQLFNLAKAHKLNDAEALMAANLLQYPGYKRNIELIGNMSKDGYTMLDEYYVINYKPNETHDTTSIALDGTPYSLNFSAVTEEMYIAFTTLKDGEDRWLVSSEYCKYSYGWKLNNLSVDKFTVGGKNSDQLYKLAQQQYAKGYLIDALSNMQSAFEHVRPGPLWSYQHGNDMNAFFARLTAQFYKAYHFPMRMESVKSAPQILRIANESRDQGTWSAISYISKISIKDTTALKVENVEIMKKIGQFMPGIDKDKKYLYFSVYNQKPSSSKSIPSFDIVSKL